MCCQRARQTDGAIKTEILYSDVRYNHVDRIIVVMVKIVPNFNSGDGFCPIKGGDYLLFLFRLPLLL